MRREEDDVSRTIGWFTSVYPVRFTAPEGDDSVAALRDVRAAVRRVPRHGVGYGALRYLRDGEIVGLLRSASPPEVIFNYWGQLDQVFSASAAVRPAHVPAGATRSPRQTRSYVFEVSAGVIDGRLQALWTYSSNLHAPETIERLAAALRQTVSRLSALPDHTRASLKTPVEFSARGGDPGGAGWHRGGGRAGRRHISAVAHAGRHVVPSSLRDGRVRLRPAVRRSSAWPARSDLVSPGVGRGRRATRHPAHRVLLETARAAPADRARTGNAALDVR